MVEIKFQPHFVYFPVLFVYFPKFPFTKPLLLRDASVKSVSCSRKGNSLLKCVCAQAHGYKHIGATRPDYQGIADRRFALSAMTGVLFAMTGISAALRATLSS
jgi:hypothetical protein